MLASLLLSAVLAGGDFVVLGATRDNTLFESSTGSLSSGASPHVWVGRTGQFQDYRRRGLLHFDVAGAVPSGAHVDAVTLTLHCNKTVAGPEPVAVRAALADWGEAGSSGGGGGGGGGAPAQPGDATWIHAFYPATFWSTAGGDFAAVDSAVRTVGAANTSYAWGGPGMVADVQGWLDDPASNFGWVLLGNEGASQTTKRFSSRTHVDADERPTLRVDYSFPPPCPGDTDGDGDVDVDDLNAVILDWGTGGTANHGDVTGPAPGSPPDGIVDVNDLNAVILGWGACP